MMVELENGLVEVLNALKSQAEARGLSLEQYLLLFAEAGDATSGNGADLSPEGFDQLLDELSEGLPPLPPLPADFSRRDIYSEHD
jgi:hypothetical protein